jgi:hypothetical protein
MTHKSLSCGYNYAFQHVSEKISLISWPHHKWIDTSTYQKQKSKTCFRNKTIRPWSPSILAIALSAG